MYIIITCTCILYIMLIPPLVINTYFQQFTSAACINNTCVMYKDVFVYYCPYIKCLT